MRQKIYATFLALAVALTVILFVSGGRDQRAAASPAASYIVSSLPESDAVIFVDAQRLLADTIPGVLANDPALLARVNAQIDRFKEQTDIDLRLFDSVAVGVRFKDPAKSEDYNFVILAQGRFDANTVLKAGLAAAGRDGGVQPQERQYDGRTIYVMTRGQAEDRQAEDKQEADAPQATGGHVMAFAVFDANTLAFGDLESVRQSLDVSAKRVDDELARLATMRSDAVVGFSGNVAHILTEQLARAAGPLAKNLGGVRQAYGSLSTAGAETETLLTLRTENADQAREIAKTISALKLLGSVNASEASAGKTMSSRDTIKKVEVASEGNEVFLSLKLPETDIASILRSL